MPASQTTSVGFAPYSEMIFTSIEAKPKIALVGCPLDVEIDSGSAKKARKTRLLPSIRKSCGEDSSGTAPPYRADLVAFTTAASVAISLHQDNLYPADSGA